MATLYPQRQQRILSFIEEFCMENGLPPTIREIQIACEIPSTSSVFYYLDKLADKGLIERNDSVARGIRIPGLRENSESYWEAKCKEAREQVHELESKLEIITQTDGVVVGGKTAIFEDRILPLFDKAEDVVVKVVHVLEL